METIRGGVMESACFPRDKINSRRERLGCLRRLVLARLPQRRARVVIWHDKAGLLDALPTDGDLL
eukprot:7871521-Lingulodinium_polyedra.AAC.1